MTPSSILGKHWIIREDARTFFAGTAQDAAGAFVTHLAAQRGIDLRQQYALPLHGDRPQPDVGRAVERIHRAVAADEVVGIFGDYDCDGITAVAQILRFFHRRGKKPVVRLPHRQQDGYGLREGGVRSLAERGATLLLTLDTGITAGKEIALAKTLGMETIIVDHHHLPAVLPDATAIIHPELAGEGESPAAAAGLAYGLVAALEQSEGREEWEGQATDLALAAIGTVADLVELRGRNRRLVSEGLLALASLKDGPLQQLLQNAGVLGAPTSRDVGFRIAPRLNAAGRMAEPGIALKAILGDPSSLLALERLNEERQDLTKHIFASLADHPSLGTSFLAVAHADYPAGIIGLLAGRLTEQHGRPSMVAQIQGDLCVASLRSIPGFHITQALEEIAELLETFGGHAMAAGCSFPTTSLKRVTDALVHAVEKTLTAEQLRPTLSVDAVLDASHVTLPLCTALSTLEPFGQANAEPRFMLSNVRFSTLKRVGRDFSHLQGTIGPLKAVGFRMGALLNRFPEVCDVACRIGIDTWNGNNRPQIVVEDVRESDQRLAVSPSTELRTGSQLAANEVEK